MGNLDGILTSSQATLAMTCKEEKRDGFTNPKAQAPNPVLLSSSSSVATMTRISSSSAHSHIENVTQAPGLNAISEVGPPPDGGWRAWSQVIAGHLAVFNSWGYLNSFGIFQETYVQLLGQPASTVSWIGSIQVFLIFFVGVFSGRAMDAGHYRTVLWAGTILQLVGVFTTSVATGAYWHVLLAQGVCQGLGAGLYFGPTMALISTYFLRRRTLANTIAAGGSATGGVVFPLIAQNLLPRLGLAWAVRVMGFVILFNSCIVLALARPRLPPRIAGPLVEFSAFREPAFLFFALGSFFSFWAVYFGYYYSRSYATENLGTSQTSSFDILLLLSAVGLPGRIVPGFLADRWSRGRPVFVLVPNVFIAGIMLYIWSTVDELKRYFVWIAFFGWFGGAIQGMFPATIASLGHDPSKHGTRIGMIFSIASFACLTGPPLAGALIKTAHGSYLGAGLWGGSSLMLGTTFYSISGWFLVRKDRQQKAKADEKIGS